MDVATEGSVTSKGGRLDRASSSSMTPHGYSGSKILEAFTQVVQALCGGSSSATHSRVRAFYGELKKHPIGAEFCNGGQHDCKELLEVLIDQLHTDLVQHAKAKVADSKPASQGTPSIIHQT